MAQCSDRFELSGLRLTSGEGRHLDLTVRLDGFELGGEHYEATPPVAPVRLDISRTTGQGYSLRLRFHARVEGPCMRCLTPAEPEYSIDAREISQPGGGEELESPYVDDAGVLDLRDWARDALALAMPAQILCRPDCAGLCPVCGANLNEAPEHHHESAPDPRWAKLSELRFE
ncbi:MAG TPA: DUF177 domain-containing protein [Solirubrobacteraceae bacterium]|nr:DUF177 domain-containing protein [Solirubrobacteraceae bacterium]